MRAASATGIRSRFAAQIVIVASSWPASSSLPRHPVQSEKKAPVTRKWAGLARKMRLCARYRLLAARAVDLGTPRRILASFDRMRSLALLHVAFLALLASCPL